MPAAGPGGKGRSARRVPAAGSRRRPRTPLDRSRSHGARSRSIHRSPQFQAPIRHDISRNGQSGATARRLRDPVKGRAGDRRADRCRFESASGFRSAFARLLDQSPAWFTRRERLKAEWTSTPLGAVIAVSDRTSPYLLEFVDRKALPRELAQLRKTVRGDLGIGRLGPGGTGGGGTGRIFRRQGLSLRDTADAARHRFHAEPSGMSCVAFRRSPRAATLI